MYFEVVDRRDAKRLQVGLFDLLRELVHLRAERPHFGVRLGQLVADAALLVQQAPLVVAGLVELRFDASQFRFQVGGQTLLGLRQIRS